MEVSGYEYDLITLIPEEWQAFRHETLASPHVETSSSPSRVTLLESSLAPRVKSLYPSRA